MERGEKPHLRRQVNPCTARMGHPTSIGARAGNRVYNAGNLFASSRLVQKIIAQSGDTMATAVASNTMKVRAGVPGRKYDHVFFSGMAVLLLGSVFLGFAHTYYLAGMFSAPLPSAIIHIHGAIF